MIGSYLIIWLIYVLACVFAMFLLWGVLRYVRPQLAQDLLKLGCASVLFSPCETSALYEQKGPAVMVIFFRLFGVKPVDEAIDYATISGAIISVCVSLGAAMLIGLLINQIRITRQNAR